MTGNGAETRRVTGGSAPPVVLLVDDDPVSRALHTRLMSGTGCLIREAVDGQDALEKITPEVDLVVTDIEMPRIDGISLLRRIGTEHPDLPVILLTGSPDLHTAIAAVEFGAHRYLVKPIDPEELKRTVQRCLRLRRLATLRRAAEGIQREETLSFRRDGIGLRFGRALRQIRLVWQPICDHGGDVVAFECSMRSGEPGLENPAELLAAGQALGISNELGRAVRKAAADAVAKAPANVLLFVNVQASDLLDPELLDPKAPLSAHASRVVLELTEQTSSDGILDMAARMTRLRELGYRIALDDLGSGYASLSLFASLDPEFVKLDMSLIRNVHEAPHKLQLVRSLAAVFREMGKTCIAEGVEVAEERDRLREAGLDWLQGYLLGRPSERFEVRNEAPAPV